MGTRPLLIVSLVGSVTANISSAGNASECRPCTTGLPSAPESLLVSELNALGVPMGVAPFRFRIRPRSYLKSEYVSDYGEKVAHVRRSSRWRFVC